LLYQYICNSYYSAVNQQQVQPIHVKGHAMKGLHNKVRKKDHDSHIYTMIKGTLGIFTHMYNLIISYVISDLSYFV